MLKSLPGNAEYKYPGIKNSSLGGDNLVERQKNILTMLLKSNTQLKVDDLAKNFNVCSKTIRNDLKHIAAFIKAKQLQLESKPGSGVTLRGADEDKFQLLNELQGKPNLHSSDSPEARQKYILKRLLFATQRLTIRQIAQELYISRASIYRELIPVQAWLRKFHLNLRTKSNMGIEITGKEENWRSAVAAVLAGDSSKETTIPENSPSHIDKQTLKQIHELIGIDFDIMDQIIALVDTYLPLHFSDEAYTSFIIHVAIAIKRLIAKKNIQLPEPLMTELKGKKEFTIAVQLAKGLEECCHVSIPESEIGYMMLHILGAKMQNFPADTLHLDLTLGVENDTSVLIAKEIIRISQNALLVNLENDQELLNGLILHLRPTINRLRYGLTLKNPILDQIKETYPELYGVAWMTSTVFERYVGVRPNEEEIGYIALHLGAALERAQKPLRILVVCTSGIGTSELISEKLKHCFSEITIVDVLSSVALKQRSLADIDAIVSTVPVQVNKPSITVTPLLTQSDIKRLTAFFASFADQSGKLPASSNPIQVMNLQVAANCTDYEQVIYSICAQLENLDFVEPGFVLEAIEREKISFTTIGNMVAVVHGSPRYVKKPLLAICRLKRPLNWGEESVNLVLTVGLPQEKLKLAQPYMKNFYKKICKPEFIDSIRDGMIVNDLFC